jgi:anti-anti-sigma regulatory factor
LHFRDFSLNYATMIQYTSEQYDIELTDDNLIVTIIPKQDIDRKFAREFRQKANKIAVDADTSKFLLDVRNVRSIGSSGDRFIYAYKDAPSTGFDKKSMVAMVKSLDDTSHDFIVKVMSKAGFTYGLFTDISEAESWLRN